MEGRARRVGLKWNQMLVSTENAIPYSQHNRILSPGDVMVGSKCDCSGDIV